MEKTGQTFDMNAETFTLENIFAMELHRFQDKIGEIVNCAIKELAIEKVYCFFILCTNDSSSSSSSCSHSCSLSSSLLYFVRFLWCILSINTR